jgi:hypothetical protein
MSEQLSVYVLDTSAWLTLIETVIPQSPNRQIYPKSSPQKRSEPRPISNLSISNLPSPLTDTSPPALSATA